MTSYTKILKKIQNKKIKVGIVGMGYVGLPLALTFSESGFITYGYDNDKNKIFSLQKSNSYINHIPSTRIKNLINKNKFFPTNNFITLSNMDCIIICLPTPLNKSKKPNLNYIKGISEGDKNFENSLLSSLKTEFPKEYEILKNNFKQQN